jgi:chromosome segregation ATPase
MKPLAIGLGVLCLALAAPCVRAQTLEEQLRAQLVNARSQLQDLQGQQAQWEAQKAQLQQERDDARKALDAAKVELNKNKSGSTQDASALSAERSARAQDEAQIEVLQKDVASANAQSQAQLLHGNDLGAQLAQSQNQVTTCTARNKQLYQIGSEILDAYSHMTMGTVIASREPFAASERVKLENAAQAYGDRLYEQRYDPRETSVKKP